jgi:hypothetical protein
MITPAQRREARISLAMLPIGAALALAAVAGSIAAVALGLSEVIRQDGNSGWYVGWALLAAALGVRNLVRSLQNMSALDVGGMLVTAGISAVIVAAYPGWWLS